MGKENVILFIASGMKQKKKDFVHKESGNLYLNYGLLGLATQVSNKGYDNVMMFQGDFKTIGEIIEEINYAGVDIAKIVNPVLISVPSFFAISWAKEFIDTIKSINPCIKIILGGRWVVDKNYSWVKKKIENVDCISRGCPDEIITDYLNPNNWDKLKNASKSNKSFGLLNYSLLNNFKNYQPCIEICRGCGNKCDFCLEKDYPVSKIKSPKEVIEEAKQVCELYGSEQLNFYFEASIFNPTLSWANEFFDLYIDNNMKFKWRFETRVDLINLDVIELLSKSGLKVIDLGLESASIAQIKGMNKSKYPERYLSNADMLIKKLYDCNVWPKLNILLYLGENNQTIRETMAWLDNRKKYIKGVSVNPFILYLNGEDQSEYYSMIEKVTKSKIDINILNNQGYIYIDLSDEINIDRAKILSKEISDRYMTNQDYLDLKSVCYSKRDYN